MRSLLRFGWLFGLVVLGLAGLTTLALAQQQPSLTGVVVDAKGPVANAQKKYFKGQVEYWNDLTTHGTYDEYWQEAFEHNSIDYLLKPVKQDKLEAALSKYDKLKQHFATSFQQLMQWHRHPADNGYKKRFLVKRGTDYISVKTEDIAYFYATHKLVCMVDNKNQKFILDQSLAEIEKQLDPAQFYRINRKYFVQHNSIKKIKTYPKSKLQLELEPSVNEDIIISQENVAAFKAWMGQ